MELPGRHGDEIDRTKRSSRVSCMYVTSERGSTGKLLCAGKLRVVSHGLSIASVFRSRL